MKKLALTLALCLASITSVQAKVVTCEDKIDSITVQPNNDVWIWFEYEDTAKLKANHSRRYELLGRAYIAMANKETVRFKIDNGELRSTKCHDLDTGFSTLIDIVN